MGRQPGDVGAVEQDAPRLRRQHAGDLADQRGLAGAVGGLAGALIANQSSYVSPSLLHWIQSGTLMIMVILGGVGTLWGGVIGAAILLGLEHLITDYRIGWLASLAPNYQDHAGLAIGIVLLAIVMLAPEGIAGLALKKRHA